jgi:hypothetical protein
MLVLSGVFNTTTRMLDATNYANQDHMRVNLHTYSCLHYALSNRQSIKKRFMFLPGYDPIAIADWSIIVQWQCHLHLPISTTAPIDAKTHV